MRLKPLTDWLVYVLIRVVICVIQALPLDLCQTFSKGLAIVATDIARLRYGVVEDNLRHVFPDWDDAYRHRFIRRMWEHLFLMVAEVAQARRKIHETSFRRVCDVYQQAIAGQVFAGSPANGHGNWALREF